MKQRGFTLIELLVVISIVSFLSSIIIGSLAGSRVKANNAAINRTILQYANAAELYRAKYGAYPLTAATFTCLGSGYSTPGNTCGWCASTTGDCAYAQGVAVLQNGVSNTLQQKFSEFISSYPPVNTKRFVVSSTHPTNNNWLGAAYVYNGASKEFYWVLETPDQKCARPANAITLINTNAQNQDSTIANGTICRAALQ